MGFWVMVLAQEMKVTRSCFCIDVKYTQCGKTKIVKAKTTPKNHWWLGSQHTQQTATLISLWIKHI
jgi:hypothetical protein